MPCPHFSVSICSRGNGGSAVASAAYQSGEKLFCEYDEHTKNFTYKTEEVVYKEILLPRNAPKVYYDRATLWNSAEAAEPNWNSQLARKAIAALPKELSDEDNIKFVREFIREEFVSKGMCADFAIHRPKKKEESPEEENHKDNEEQLPAGLDALSDNIHVHIMLTMRAIDEDGNWLAKSRKEYLKDENGNPILDKKGNLKTRKIFTTDWDNKNNVEHWRKAWETKQNAFLEKAGCTERVCLDSYEKQGIEQIPTVHKGPAVCAMERRGVVTETGNINRAIEEVNRLIKELGRVVKKLSDWISDVIKGAKQLDIEPREISISTMCLNWYHDREEQRKTWTNIYAIRKASLNDLHKFSKVYAYIGNKKINTLSDLEKRVSDISESLRVAKNVSKSISRQKSKIEGIIEHAERKKQLDHIHKKANTPILWKKKYREEHSAELKEWDTCAAYLRINLPDKGYNRKELQKELESLEIKSSLKFQEVKELNEEKEMLGYIWYIIKDYIPELKLEEKKMTSEEKAIKRKSVRERLAQNKITVEKNKAEKTYIHRLENNHTR